MPTYLTAALLARTGDEGAKLAVMLLALAVATPSVGGWGVACLMAPHVLAAPVMGRWIDRSPVPHRILGVAAIGFSLFLAVACAYMGLLPDLVVMALLLGAGMFGPAITGGLSSLIRLLTTPGGLPRAFGLDSLVYNVAGMIGPAVAASVAVALPRGAGYLVAGLVAVAAVPLFLLRPRVRAEGSPDVAPRPSYLGGLRSMARDRDLAVATAATSVAQIGAGVLAVALPLRAYQLSSPQWAGWWFAAMSAGALLGSVAWTVRPAPAPSAGRVVALALACTGIALIGASAVTDPWLVALTVAVAGLANGPQFGALQVVRDRGSRAQDRAGVFTLAAGIKVAAAALGTAVAGQLAALSPQVLLLCAGLAPLLAGVAASVLGGRGSSHSV